MDYKIVGFRWASPIRKFYPKIKSLLIKIKIKTKWGHIRCDLPYRMLENQEIDLDYNHYTISQLKIIV